ncbi:MAG: FecR domain-containing protein [Verrucomicrobiales bacterium]|nr:FecR domain-containing protein [Verrucomicrobiales bacterium]
MSQKDRITRVGEITSAWLDNQASGEDLAELNQLLQGDPDACEQYLDLIEIHAALTQDQAGESVAEQMAALVKLPAPRRESAKRRKPTPYFIAAALAAVMVLGLVVFYFQQPSEPMTEGGVAVISRLVNPVWEETSRYLEGDILKPGDFRLKSGLAQLEFFSGASVVVEGPADLDLISAWIAKCETGRLRVSVTEPARGFTIETNDYRAVDLGTEFALTVEESGRSEVHVLEGEVRLDDHDGAELKLLTEGVALQSQGGTKFEALSPDREAYVNHQQLMALVQDDWRTRYQVWTRSREKFRSQPGVLALFDFENQKPWDRQLENHGPGASNGAIIGAQWSEGRWPGKGALEFKRPSDRVRLNIPGTFDELTLSSWVRVQSLDKWLSSIMLTDGFEPGEVHWQITDEGELILGVSEAKPHSNGTSPPVISPEDFGRWIHLAVTIDRNSGVIAHYFDGKMVSSHSKTAIPPLKIGKAEIGNWQAQEKKHPLRSLNGRIDELIIFDRVLSPTEIAALCDLDS